MRPDSKYLKDAKRWICPNDIQVSDFGILQPPAPAGQAPGTNREGWIPARIHLADYPQLKQLAWQVHGTDELTPAEALSIYERNWRHVDANALEPRERQLIDALRTALGETNGIV